MKHGIKVWIFRALFIIAMSQSPGLYMSIFRNVKRLPCMRQSEMLTFEFFCTLFLYSDIIMKDN